MREAILHRPAVLLAAGLCLGVLAPESPLGSFLAAISLAAWFRAWAPGLVLAVGFVLGCVVSRPLAGGLHAEQWIDGEALVTSVPRDYPTESVQEVVFQGHKLQMTTGREVRLSPGDRIHIKGEAKPLAEGSVRLARRGIVGKIRPASVQVLARGPWITRAGVAWRGSFAAFCERWLPPATASEVQAICFNLDSALDQEARDRLNRSGLVHIVSASGMHVAILALAICGALALLPIPRALQLVALGAVLLVYAVASGLNPPVVRATLMVLTLSFAFSFQREPDMLSALAFAAVAQLLWDASAIFDPGFQLSFVVVAAFAMFSTHHRAIPTPGIGQILLRARQVAVTSFIASLAAAPLLAYYFGLVSLTSIPANLLVAAGLPVLVVCAMAAHLLSLVFPSLGVGILVGIVGPVTAWIDAVAEHLGGIWAALNVPAFSGYWVLFAYALMILAWRPRLRRA